jgi:hypothetical protein
VYRQPWGYGPYWAYGYPPYAPTTVSVAPPAHAHQGQIKIDTKAQDDPVFIDGAYVGTVKDVPRWIYQSLSTGVQRRWTDPFNSLDRSAQYNYPAFRIAAPRRLRVSRSVYEAFRSVACLSPLVGMGKGSRSCVPADVRPAASFSWN